MNYPKDCLADNISIQETQEQIAKTIQNFIVMQLWMVLLFTFYGIMGAMFDAPLLIIISIFGVAWTAYEIYNSFKPIHGLKIEDIQ